jgi:hypothetical protein
MIVKQKEFISWEKGDFVKFKATGILTNGKPMSPIVNENWFYIQGINLWRGHKWALKPDGHWLLLETVWN